MCLSSLLNSKKNNNNINIYWIGASALAIWFLFIHSPPILIQRRVWLDLPFLLHLLGSYTIYMSCMFNTICTPLSSSRSSSSKSNAYYHFWVGRIGLIGGFVGFVLGLYVSWWPWRDPKPPLGFSIGISIGGIGQVYSQIQGYNAMRQYQYLRDELLLLKTKKKNASTERGYAKLSSSQTQTTTTNDDNRIIIIHDLEQKKNQALQIHIESMISLFVVACGTPAAMRIADIIGFGGDNNAVGIIVVIVAILTYSANSYSKIFLKRLSLLCSSTSNSSSVCNDKQK